MNKYGARAMAHWKTHAPERYQRIEDPTGFFTELGLQAQAQISELAERIETTPGLLLASPPSSRENWLHEVARRTTAIRVAEEVVMHQLAWVSDPALPLDQAREEWEQTRASDDNLIVWAERMQDSPDLMPSTVELEQLALDWAVPTSFLEGLVATEPPRDYARKHRDVLAEAATIRFLREVR